MNTLETYVTPEQLEAIQTAEAVVVCEYKIAEDHWCRVAFVGTKQECEKEADRRELLFVPTGKNVIGKRVILASELLHPKTVAGAET